MYEYLPQLWLVLGCCSSWFYHMPTHSWPPQLTSTVLAKSQFCRFMLGDVCYFKLLVPHLLKNNDVLSLFSSLFILLQHFSSAHIGSLWTELCKSQHVKGWEHFENASERSKLDGNWLHKRKTMYLLNLFAGATSGIFLWHIQIPYPLASSELEPIKTPRTSEAGC